MRKIRNNIKPKIDDHCRFVEDKCTNNPMYILRNLSERMIEM